MEQTLSTIVADAKTSAKTVTTRAELDHFKAQITGPNGSLTGAMKGIGKLPAEERPVAGKLINKTKQELEAIFSPLVSKIEDAELANAVGPAVDPSLPSSQVGSAALHPITQVRQRITDIFKTMGFSVGEGPEIDTEWFCFDALNTPEDHPARDEQDTLYMPKSCVLENVSKKADERYILRTQTSTVQIRTMLKEKPPLRIIAPGRVFRRDTVDATHSANFHQVEALCVDENITIKDLKSTLDYFIHALLGDDLETRLRPSFFPFTEPSFELDVRLKNFGRLSNQWIEMMGCGMVDPEVFKAVGYENVSGFACGMGLERFAMLLYGVDDIRHFYQNDIRFLEQFK